MKQLEALNLMKELKLNNSFEDRNLTELQKLPSYSGVWNLTFQNKEFMMLNIKNDDGIPLKYFWRNGYEKYSLDVWYKITNTHSLCIDVGAHSGIYSIIGNLHKNNNIISIEPYYLNYVRLLDNLKLNSIPINLCFMAAASNFTGTCKFDVKVTGYHANGGKISKDGNIITSSIELDKMNIKSDVSGIKIDTEGNEFEVLEGAKNIIDKYKPHIILEYNTSSFKKCKNYLVDLGYSYFYIDDNKKLLIKDIDNLDTEPDSEGKNYLFSSRIEELSL